MVVAAALLNALKATGKELSRARGGHHGAGSAGIAIARHLMNLGLEHLTMVDSCGILCEGMEELNPAQREMALCTNREKQRGGLADAMRGADVFIGVSAPGIVPQGNGALHGGGGHRFP